MRPALAVAALLVALAPAGQALTLLAHEPGPDTTVTVRVDDPPLEAEAIGNVTVADAEITGSRAPLDVPLGPWRGFANATTLNARGPGTLLLADGASGLVVPIEAPPSEGSRAQASEQREDGPRPEAGSREGPEAQRTGAEAAEPGSPTGPSTAEATNPREQGAARGDDEADEPLGGLGSPVAIALAALAAGAFVVERWLAGRGSRREPEP